MAKEAVQHLFNDIHASLKKGTLHIDRLKDPNSDCQVDILVGETTHVDCKERILHYRDSNKMLAYTTKEVIAQDGAYYYLEIKEYSKNKTLQNQSALHTILKRNSCVTSTAKSW